MNRSIKVCGITRVEDAVMAAEFGALAVGFIFSATSPRLATAEVALACADHLPSQVERIGVFVDSPRDEVVATVKSARLTGVQLHGRESSDFIRDLRKTLPKLLIVRALTVDEHFIHGAVNATVNAGVDAVLFDSPKVPGASRLLAVDRVLPLLKFARHDKHKIFIAGGLNAANVTEVIERMDEAVAPQLVGVDVCGGIESQAGIKSREAMADFFMRLGASRPRSLGRSV